MARRDYGINLGDEDSAGASQEGRQDQYMQDEQNGNGQAEYGNQLIQKKLKFDNSTQYRLIPKNIYANLLG